MKKIDEILNGVSCMAIAGHVRPDGDCIGSCLGLYQYLRDNRPEIQADVYLEDPRPEFSYLPGFSEVKTSCEEKAYDLVVLLDVSSEERIGVAVPLLAKAGKTICIDHHVTNTEYCEINHVEPDASSACEVLFGLLEEEKISEPCAEALYTLSLIHIFYVYQNAGYTGAENGKSSSGVRLSDGASRKEASVYGTGIWTGKRVE